MFEQLIGFRGARRLCARMLRKWFPQRGFIAAALVAAMPGVAGASVVGWDFTGDGNDDFLVTYPVASADPAVVGLVRVYEYGLHPYSDEYLWRLLDTREAFDLYLRETGLDPSLASGLSMSMFLAAYR